MKSFLVLTSVVMLTAGCVHPQRKSDIAGRLEAMQQVQTDLAAEIADLARGVDLLRAETTNQSSAKAARDNGAAPLRLAVVDRGRLSNATAKWTQQRIQEAEAKEVIPEELREAMAKYEELQNEVNRRRGEVVRNHMMRRGPRAGFIGSPDGDPEIVKLVEELAAAREPVAEILDRRGRRHMELQYPVEALVREYVADRFDLVIDRNSLDHAVLFRRSLEVIDITDGVIALFHAKETQ